MAIPEPAEGRLHGKAHRFWLDSEHASVALKKQRRLANRNQMVFLYYCGDLTLPSPDG
jgi:hypothetical protein